MTKRILRAALCAMLALSLFLPAAAISPAASPDPQPTLETHGYNWPLGQALPSFSPPAKTLDAIDIYGLLPGEHLAVSVLQGIVNRAQPRIYLVDYCRYRWNFWGEALELDLDFQPWRDVLLTYLSYFNGLVIYNPEIEATANVALTIAGVRDALAVSPELAQELMAAPFHLPVHIDLRDQSEITCKLSAYRWLHANYWQYATRRTISGLIPLYHFQWQDFAVAVRAAVVWLCPLVPEEREVLQLFFNDLRALDCIYTGWWPIEGPGIAFATRHGIPTIPSDFYMNYTVFAGQCRQLEFPPIPAKPDLEPGMIYVSLNFSDGDNIQYITGAMRIPNLWGSSRRGEIPIGWTFQPAMIDAGPQVFQWYLNTATENDVFICGPSGLGYTTVARWPNRNWVQAYGAMTNDYFERTNMNILTAWWRITGSRARWITGAMPSLLGLTVQFEYGQRVQYTRSGHPVVWFGSDVPGSRGAMSYDNGIENFRERLSAAAQWDTQEPQFIMAQAEVWSTNVYDFNRLADELEEAYPGRFVWVRPDHLMMLLNEYHAKPFHVSLQASAIDHTGAPALVTDGTFSTGWEASAPGQATLQIDLGQTVVLDRYVLKSASTNHMDPALNSVAWELHASADGEIWFTADTVRNNNSAIAYRNLRSRVARYIRLVITDPGADGIARVQELEIHGVPTDRAHNPRVRLRSFFHDLQTWFMNPVYEVVAWWNGMQAPY